MKRLVGDSENVYIFRYNHDANAMYSRPFPNMYLARCFVSTA